MNVKEELEELIQFGTEIEFSAWNLISHKREKKEFAKKSKKNPANLVPGAKEEFRGSVDAFSDSIQNVNQ